MQVTNLMKNKIMIASACPEAFRRRSVLKCCDLCIQSNFHNAIVADIVTNYSWQISLLAGTLHSCQTCEYTKLLNNNGLRP